MEIKAELWQLHLISRHLTLCGTLACCPFVHVCLSIPRINKGVDIPGVHD